jgi:hypothetical protein
VTVAFTLGWMLRLVTERGEGHPAPRIPIQLHDTGGLQECRSAGVQRLLLMACYRRIGYEVRNLTKLQFVALPIYSI